MSACKAIWTGLGASLHHEAEVAEDIVAWGDAIWAANMGDVWIMAPGLQPVSLADFKKEMAVRPNRSAG
jgi:hypothetical protein